jgi:hypothetical protein
VLKDNAEATRLRFEINRLDFTVVPTDSGKMNAIRAGDEPTISHPGLPDLPMISRVILVPPTSGIHLNITQSESSIRRDLRPMNAAPESGEESAVIAARSELFSGDGFFPPEPIQIGKPAIIRGWRVVPVTFFPVQFNPSTGETRINDRTECELSYSGLGENIVRDPDRPRPSRYVDRLLRSVAANPPPPRDEVEVGGSIVYVLGSGRNWDDLLDEIQPLIDWRCRMGWTVETIRVQHPEEADEVKDALQDAYDEWETPPEYIVLCGDAQSYYNEGYPIAYWNKQAGAGNPYESDHPYTLLEGDDILPEAAIGRLIVDDDVGMMRDQVNKTIDYESNPYMGEGDDAGWFLRGAVAAVTSVNGTSPVDLCRGIRDLLIDHSFTDVGELYWDAGHQQVDPSEFITDHFDSGISFFVFRGGDPFNGYFENEVMNMQNGGMLPFVLLATCNTADYGEPWIWGYPQSVAEYFMTNPDGGGIGCVGMSGASHTAYNNLIAASIMRAPFIEEIYSQGWALMRGKLSLYTHYADRGDIMHEENREMEAWESEYWEFNLMGDPAVDLYTAIPKTLEVEHPDVIRTGETRFEASVTDAETGEPVAGAMVCLYKPEVFQLRARTNAEGKVVFSVNPDWTQDGEIQFTVTGHNLKAYLKDYEVDIADLFIGAWTPAIDDDAEGQSMGDGDGIANPTERLELTVPIVNYGNNVPEGEVTATLTTSLPHLEVVEGEAAFDAAPASGESVAATFVVDIGGGFPAGQDAVFNLTVTIGEEEWFSAVVVPVVGPDLQFASLEWDGDPLIPSGIADLHIILKNVGGKDSPDLVARLISLTPTVSVVEDNSIFSSIRVGESETSEDLFEVSASLFHLGGNPARFALALEGDNGFQDTAFFSFIIEDIDYIGKPFGPDDYGYVCFDDTDVDWFARPEYEWVEIDPEEGGEGADTELRDVREEDDKSVMIAFPDEFNFLYYGQEYDRITICTNGWAALGDRSDRDAFRNRKIPDGECVPAMLCPFWEELITTHDGGVFYWFDEENHRYIIEWSQMRKFGPRGDNEASETFELILYDPRYWPSFTGDGMIEFQYQDVTDDRSCFQEYDTPFATVGIVSPDLKTGLEYVYWNEYHPGAAELADGRVIKFTTIVEYRMAWARGMVTDAATGDSLEGVHITTKFGFYGVTDVNGAYFIDNMLASADDSAFYYWFKASKQGWNDSTVYDIDLPEGDTVTVDFALLHPEFLLEPAEMNMEMLADTLVEREVMLSNDGNGPLYFNSKFTYDLGENRRDEMWDQLLTWNAEDSTGHNAMRGVTYSNDRWIVAGDGDHGEANLFFIFSRRGDYQGEIQQPEGLRGIRDIEAHGDYIYAVPFADYYVKLDAVTLEEAFRVPLNFRMHLDAITLDQNGLVYTSSVTGSIYVYEETDDTTANQVASYETVDPRSGANIFKYGLSWFRDDPDGYQLYIMGKTDVGTNGKNLYKLNVETGDIRFVTDFAMLSAIYDCKGISITPRWNNMVWVLSAVFNHPEGDQVFVFELGPNASWLRYEPTTDTLNAGESMPIALHFNTEGLELGDYGIVIDFIHNALGGLTRLPISLEVANQPDWIDGAVTPAQFSLAQNRPNPFNPVTVIDYSLPKAGWARLELYDTQGRLVRKLWEGFQAAGNHQYLLNGSDLPAGLYLYRLASENKIQTRKLVLTK